MSGICGWVGAADPAVLDAMLAAIDYRGDRTDTAVTRPASALGYRWWGGRPGKSPGIHRDGHAPGRLRRHARAAGRLAGRRRCCSGSTPARRRRHSTTLDGAFAAAWWDGERRPPDARARSVRRPLALLRRARRASFYFASELKQLLAVPGLPVELDPPPLHKYLTFSFVPGEDVPIQGIRRLLPGHVADLAARPARRPRPYFTLREEIDPALEDQPAAVRLIRERCQQAVARAAQRRARRSACSSPAASTRPAWPSGSRRPASASRRSASTSASAASSRSRRRRSPSHLEHPADLRAGRRRGRWRRRSGTWSGSSTCRSAIR